MRIVFNMPIGRQRLNSALMSASVLVLELTTLAISSGATSGEILAIASAFSLTHTRHLSFIS